MSASTPHRRARTALAALLIAAALPLAIEGCGLKGALYLPPQKKSKLPATAPTNTTPPTNTTAPSDSTPAAPSAPAPAANAPPA